MRQHIPDYLLLTGQAPVVVDVKPLHRLSKPEVAFTFDWTREAVPDPRSTHLELISKGWWKAAVSMWSVPSSIACLRGVGRVVPVARCAEVGGGIAVEAQCAESDAVGGRIAEAPCRWR
ncbi:hypothetical protein ACFV6Z_18010 [Streptomyces sp. NPDC059818]|uniref:hypothetical protein n=1 Tax=Streptomyces sp. NPDC059818 TaxID=3346962 RepID=UPI003647B426